jgi:flagellar basal body P-ring protein FlgI
MPSTPPPTLSLSFSPPNPSVPSNAAAGTVVAQVIATWSNGKQFTGILDFTTPYGSDSNIFAIFGNNVIVNPSGPGLSADGNTVQNVSVIAIQ